MSNKTEKYYVIFVHSEHNQVYHKHSLFAILFLRLSYTILRKIARKRGMLLPGNEENTERAAIMLCDEFRASKLGKISLERPEDYV